MGTDLFAGLGEAKVFERGAYLPPGSFKLEIMRTLTKRSQNSGEVFIVEFKVLESTNPERPAGSNASWVQTFKNQTIALSSIKEFLIAVLGVKPSDAAGIKKISEQLEGILNDAVASPDDNALTGNQVRVDVNVVKTKKGNDFNRHDWKVA